MNAPLDAASVEKLVKIVGMFNSAHDGERAAAAALADKLVRDAGLRWVDVILPPIPFDDSPMPTPRAHTGWRRPASPQALAVALLTWSDVLTPWEVKFCGDIKTRRRVSAKQLAVLNSIEAKVAAFAEAGERRPR